jgi:hypothetical protein
MARVVEKVKDRLLRVAAALEKAGVPYAVAGGNAVAAWVATVDEMAVRNTRDVDVLLNRRDLERAKQALEAAGFGLEHVAGVDLFLDGATAKAPDAVRVVFAGEKVRPEYELAAPGMDQTEIIAEGLRVIALDALLRMKLTSFRRKDQVHLLDLIGVGLVGEKNLADLPPALADRLRELLQDRLG